MHMTLTVSMLIDSNPSAMVLVLLYSNSKFGGQPSKANVR